MSPKRPPAGAPYSIEFSARAWSQVGTLPRDAFSKLQRAVNRVAETAGGALLTPPRGVPVASGDVRLSYSATVDDLVVLYELDEARRKVLVLQLVRTEPPGPGRGEPSAGR